MRDPLLEEIPDELVGERVVVRRYRRGDGAALNEAVIESRENLIRWMPWAKPIPSVEESEILVRRFAARFALHEDFPLGIWFKESGRYLGGTGMHRIDWSARAIEIGYWMRVTEQGKGYTTEAAKLIRDFAFSGLAANRVMIQCSADNLPSAAVARKAGFKLEGRLRNHKAYEDGTLHDTLIFGMTPAEWSELPRP
jgi:RimJ/RimL family protein N-acetyltransferase